MTRAWLQSLLVVAAVLLGLLAAAWLSAGTARSSTGCGGLLEPPCPTTQTATTTTPVPTTTTPAPAPAHANVTLQVSRSVVPVLADFGGIHTRVPAVTVTGRVRTRGSSAGLRVDIVAVPPAFPREHLILRTRTARNGAFRLTFHPHVDLVLIAALSAGQAAAGTSHAKIIVVLPNLSLNTTRVYQFPHHAPEVTLILTAYAPSAFPVVGGSTSLIESGSARRVFFYGGTTARGRFRRVGVGALSGQIGCGGEDCSTTGEATIRVTPSLLSIRYLIGCTSGTIFKGIGLPDPSCGGRSLIVR